MKSELWDPTCGHLALLTSKTTYKFKAYGMIFFCQLRFVPQFITLDHTGAVVAWSKRPLHGDYYWERADKESASQVVGYLMSKSGKFLECEKWNQSLEKVELVENLFTGD